jgi:5-methylthioadenosine/S-adenosylhomocysteine deaminase
MLLGMSENLLITADWILPISGAPLEGGAVDVREGRIHAVGSARELLPAAEESRRIDLGQAALLPGLVNTHAHLELTALRGFLEEDDFFSWIRKLTDTKYGRLDEEDLLCSARLGVIEATRAGITTIADIADAGVSLAALVEGGLRSVLYQEVFGPDPDQAEASLEGLKEKLAAHEAARTQRVSIGISPHAPYTVSRRLFEMVAEFALSGGYPVSVHAAESAAEAAFVQKAEGPFADYLRSRDIEVKPLGESTIRFLEETGLLETSPLLAHCIDCSEEDLRIVAGSGSAIAHCPKSNAKLGHGTAPLAAMLREGARVGLGSDGVVCNNTCDLLEEARFGALLQRAGGEEDILGAGDFLRLATLGGAAALGLDGDIGSIEEGKLADLCAVNLGAPHLEPVLDVEAAVLWSASARDVILTVVEGEVLYDGRELRRLDEAFLSEPLETIREKLSNS